jgi:sulfotransferase
MKKTYHFMAGLPRSGSTVLSALLNQHPKIYSSPQTDLINMLYSLHSELPKYESYKANVLVPNYDFVVKQVPDNFYSTIDKPIVIDKNRSWGTPYNFNNLSYYLNVNGKVILTLRPILEVLASFVKISKANNESYFMNSDLWLSEYRNESDAIVDSLMMPNGEIDKTIFSVANLLKNHRDRVFVVWFNDLLEAPQTTLNKLYDFLGLERIENDFKNIVEIDKHDDVRGYGIKDLHKINKTLLRPETDPNLYLSDYAIKKYQNALDFLWD